MGYIKRKLDFSERWYPSKVLLRYAYLVVFYDLGFILILFMITNPRIDYLGLSSDHSTLGRSILYVTVGMLLSTMVLTTLVGSVALRRSVRLKGMVLREFHGSIEPCYKALLGLFDERTLEVVGSERMGRADWRQWPDVLPLIWMRSEGTGHVIAVGRTFAPNRVLVAVGSVDRKGEREVEKLLAIIEASLTSVEGHADGIHPATGDLEARDEVPGSAEGKEPTFTDSPRIRM